MHELPPFHLAFPVASLAQARAFYGDLLGCPEGRSSESWVDFDFHGHQIVAHVAPEELRAAAAHDVDGDNVPVRHFGLVLDMEAWHALADKLRTAGTRFVIEPHVRFGPAGRTGHDVPARPVRQRAGVQGIRGPLEAICEMIARAKRGAFA